MKQLLILLFVASSGLLVATQAQVNVQIKISVNGSDVNLYWFAEGQADVEQYIIERSVDGRNWNAIVELNGNGMPEATYTYDDLGLADDEYAYRLTVVFSNGDHENLGHEIVLVNVAPSFKAVPNFPDPIRNNTINQ